MKLRRIFAIVKMEMTRQIIDPLVLIFTTLLVPALILIFGLIMGDSYGWGSDYTVFEHMLPGFIAYAGLLTIYDVAAGVASEFETGIQKRISTTPLRTSEYVLSQMISYTIKPIIQLNQNIVNNLRINHINLNIRYMINRIEIEPGRAFSIYINFHMGR